MALKDILISSLPQYSDTLPSGKQVFFRPMVVSEEKSLLLAKQSEDKKSILKTLSNILSNCFEAVDIKKTTVSDFEYMFLILRAKSIGEIEGFIVKCPETGLDVNIKVNLSKDIKLNKTKQNNKIKLNDNLVLMMKEPVFTSLLKHPDYNLNTEDLYGYIASCIKSIQNQKESIDCSEMPEKEVVEFIQNLTPAQFKLVLNFFETIPQLEIPVEYTTDEIKRKIKIKGIFNYINFFFEHLTLDLYYRQNFQLKYYNDYGLEEIESMIPWERTVYIEQIRQDLNQEKQLLMQKRGMRQDAYPA